MPDKNTYEAIVVGSGISGGWAAKELCDHGIKTLLLERGRNVEHVKDYPTATKNPWDFKHRGDLTQLKEENPIDTAAKAHGVSVFQVALAWLLQRSSVMLPIPGTSSLAHLEENVAAARLKLTPEEWKAIDALRG